MRLIDTSEVIIPLSDLLHHMSQYLPEDMREALERAQTQESHPRAREALGQLLENLEVAAEREMPMCQDTGMVVVFAELGEEACLQGDLEEAINAGVAKAYTENLLRPSMLAHPLGRDTNTGDNTPAILHLHGAHGDKLVLRVAAKGGGSENQSALWMMPPSRGAAGIVEAVVQRVVEAGGQPCPPLLLGVGIGGNFETAPLLAKEALLRELGEPSPDPLLADLEAEILERVNATGIGPLGMGGDTTALAVHALAAPCHLATMPVALNLQCHAARHGTLVI